MPRPSPASQSISLNAVIGLVVVAGMLMMLSVLYARGDLEVESHPMSLSNPSTPPTGCSDPGYGIC